MEPRVSVPMAKPTQPAAVALALPAEEPLEPCFGFQGLRVRTPGASPQKSPWASAPMAEFGDEDGAGGVEALDYLGVVVECLPAEAAGAPGGGVALDGEEVLAAPGDAVERAAVLAGGDLGVAWRRPA